jgi:hypothetical protein
MTTNPNELLAQLEAVTRDLTPQGRLEVIERLIGTTDGQSTRSPDTDPEDLRRAYDSYKQKHEFEPGQLVKWKPGLRNKQLPQYGLPAIVLEVPAEAVINTAEPTDSPYFREPLNLVLGVIDVEGDLAVFHYDAQRFEPLD